MRGKPGMVSWFYNGGWEIFKVSLHRCQRGANRNGVNKQETHTDIHTKHSEKGNTEKG